MISRRYQFRVNQENDPELCKRLEEQTEGERSTFIRQALRNALGSKEIISAESMTKESPPAVKREVSISSNERKDESAEDRMNKLENIF